MFSSILFAADLSQSASDESGPDLPTSLDVSSAIDGGSDVAGALDPVTNSFGTVTTYHSETVEGTFKEEICICHGWWSKR